VPYVVCVGRGCAVSFGVGRVCAVSFGVGRVCAVSFGVGRVCAVCCVVPSGCLEHKALGLCEMMYI
jgi:hypothetical protein